MLHVSSSLPTARCLPRCQNGGLCLRFNRCVCRRGFQGERCEARSVSPGLLPVLHAPEGTTDPQGLSSSVAARSGPAAVLPPVPTRTYSAAPHVKPRSTAAETFSKDDTRFPRAGVKPEGAQTRTQEKVHHLSQVRIQESEPQSLLEEGWHSTSEPQSGAEGRGESVSWTQPGRRRTLAAKPSGVSNLTPTGQRQQESLDLKVDSRSGTLGGSEAPGEDSNPGLTAERRLDAAGSRGMEAKTLPR